MCLESTEFFFFLHKGLILQVLKIFIKGPVNILVQNYLGFFFFLRQGFTMHVIMVDLEFAV